MRLSFSEERERAINSARTDLNALLRLRAEFQIQRTRRNYYFNGLRPSHLLAVTLHQNARYSNIIRIRSQQTRLSDPVEINVEFRSFYASLHTSEITLDKDKCNFLSTLNLPSLTLEEANNLSGPIILAESHKALKSN